MTLPITISTTMSANGTLNTKILKMQDGKTVNDTMCYSEVTGYLNSLPKVLSGTYKKEWLINTTQCPFCNNEIKESRCTNVQCDTRVKMLTRRLLRLLGFPLSKNKLNAINGSNYLSRINEPTFTLADWKYFTPQERLLVKEHDRRLMQCPINPISWAFILDRLLQDNEWVEDFPILIYTLQRWVVSDKSSYRLKKH